MRDRDMMNLLDQLELYIIDKSQGRVSQHDYWKFVYDSMKSGLLLTKQMEKHLQYKLQNLNR